MVENMRIMTPRRYFDWMILPNYVIFNIIFLNTVNERKEIRSIYYKKFYEENKDNVHKIAVYNALMLLFGYLGEQEI